MRFIIGLFSLIVQTVMNRTICSVKNVLTGNNAAQFKGKAAAVFFQVLVNL